jgi:glycosyltransferase involved in cell wall biosynthesis
VSRYLIDGRSLQDGSSTRGIGTYLRGLLTGLASIGAGQDIELLLERDGSIEHERAAGGMRVHRQRLPHTVRHLRPLVDPMLVRRALGRPRPDLYHAVEWAQPIASPVPVVVTVHDLVPFVMPREYPWMRRERILALRQLRRADAVIAVSRSTARDVERLAHVDPSRITVIPEGVEAAPPVDDDEVAALRARFRLPSRYVLAVGTFDPRKRVDILVEVTRALRQHHEVGLVIVGEQGNFAPEVSAAIARAGIASATRVLGHVPGPDLSALYVGAECLLFTSGYEGFGLPPLEAMAHGTPAAVFDNSSLPEVVGGAGLVIPDGDARAMAEAVGRLLVDPAERGRLARLGQARAAGLTWERAAEATLAIYRSAVARHRARSR